MSLNSGMGELLKSVHTPLTGKNYNISLKQIISLIMQ